MKRIFTLVCFISFSTFSPAQTIKIWPDTGIGSGVTYGADVKLTLFRITDYNRVNQKFMDLGMDMVRIPVIAHWGSTDGRYQTIKNYVSHANGQGLKIFASIANSNGKFKPNGDLADAHGNHKFPNWMKCNTAGGTLNCSNRQQGLYGIKLPKYKSYLQTVVNSKIGNVDWVGPWNEDNANKKDYTDLDFGKTIVGAELWSLSKSDDEMAELGDAIDIGGAHNYDNNSNLKLAYDDWRNFRDKGGDWFTESTLFAKSLSEGIAHMLPAISEGMKKIIIYQTVPRIVTANGDKSSKFDAVKELIKNSKGKGSARKVEVNNKNYVAAAFKSGNQLILHVCNISTATQTIYINLQQGYKVNTNTCNLSIAKYGGNIAGVTFANGGAQIKARLSGKTYASITLDALTNAKWINNTLKEGTGVLQEEGTKEINISPNPLNQNILNIKLPEGSSSKAVTVNITDMMGRQVFYATFADQDQLQIVLEKALTGIYQLTLDIDGKTYIKKIVKE